MTLMVPRQSEPVRAEGDGSGDPGPASVRRVAVGRIELRWAAAYLLVWAVVVFVVEVLVLWSGYAALDRLGVLTSVSQAVATVLGDEVPADGVLPALELDALLPWLVGGAGALALLWLLTLLAMVVVHNGICALTGGPRVRTRQLG
jgi:hypothetical protein